MRILFVHDTYYSKDDSGGVYAAGAFPYSLWRDRFLPFFDHVRVIGRQHPESAVSDFTRRSDGERVDFHLLPNVNTPLKRLFGSRAVYRSIFEQVKACDAVIIRGPVEFGMMAAKAARKLGKPVAVEMSGCAFDHTWFHGSWIGKLYAPVKYLRARHMVARADAVIYVTEHFLQKRYPASGVTAFASNVEMARTSDDVLTRRLKRISGGARPFVIGLIGNFGNNLKGVHIALEALNKMRDQLGDFEFRILGQGDPARFSHLIEGFNLSDHVVFSGVLSHPDEVLLWLDDVDLYLQPSFHEGLPRALIEALSRGCPALASDAGGSDELLPSQYIHPKGGAEVLASHIGSLLSPEAQAGAAERNFKTAQNYEIHLLEKKRAEFWAQFKEIVLKRSC